MSNAPIDLKLLPSSACIEADGHLTVGGCDVAKLAAEFGTPLFIYDEDEITKRCREYVSNFSGRVVYAAKAFLCGALLEIIEAQGLDLDVSTAGELDAALRAKFPVKRIVLHGNNKSTDELRDAINAGIGRIVVDSHAEMDRIDFLVTAEGFTPPEVLIRVTPGVEAHTHEFIQTGVEDTKFGFTLTGGVALDACLRAINSVSMQFVGLHCHIGSQIYVMESFDAAADALGVLADEITAQTGVPVGEVCMGGGLGVMYDSAEGLPPSIAAYAIRIEPTVARAWRAARFETPPKVSIEPGRSIVGPAALTVYEVGTIKEIANVRTYVSVDGGMSDNIRPALYGAKYEAFVPTRASAERSRQVTIAGKHCEQGDIIVRDAMVPEDLAVGDLIAVPCTGAYGYSMASNYNRVPRPAVVFVQGGEARIAIRRETLSDLCSLDPHLEQGTSARETEG